MPGGTRIAGAHLDSLVSPFGIVARTYPPSTPRGLWRLREIAADAGSGRPGQPPPPSQAIMGAGRVLDDAGLARTVAIAEAAERYAGSSSLYHDHVWSRAADLDGAVMDVARIPRCSPEEYRRPGCQVVPFDPDANIRWVKGTDLSSAEETWLPAVMTCYGIHDLAPAERFWYPISTGYAVHTDPAEALVRGICEVAERDIVSVLWLQRLPLRPLRTAALTDAGRYLLRWAEEHFIQPQIFDATTDLGVPVAYCLLTAEHDELIRQTVGGGSARSIGAAAEKAVVEAISGRLLLTRREPAPERYADFLSIDDGARFMAAPEQAGAFDFLLDGISARPSSAGPADLPAAPASALRRLIAVLADAGMQAFAVDRTTRELAGAGLTAVATVIPDLQPMTLHPLTQYRGHPRLYELPRRLGYPSLTSEELNPWPQPFP